MINRIREHLKDSEKGIPNITFSIWKKENQKLKPTDDQIYEIVADSIIGARIELPLGSGNYSENMILIDANFLYAFALANFDYPTGKYLPTNTFVADKLAIYKCRVNQATLTSRVNIIPFREKNKYDWKNKSSQEIVINSVDYQQLVKYGAELIILDGIFWSEKFNPFAMIKSLAEEGLNNSGDRKLVKAALVSFSGKLTQKDYIHFSTFMYSYARRHIFENILNKIDVYLTNTDSALINKKDLNSSLLGENIGQFKIEVESDLAQLINVRKYRLYKEGKLVKSVG